MIALGSAMQETDPAFFTAPGGFAWWYLDLITPAGDGLVLIWAYGLPFLPGYAGAARRGRPQQPLQRPSVNLALYRAGRLEAYLLQEGFGEEAASYQLPAAGEPPVLPAAGSRRPAASSLNPESWLLGRSRFHTRVERGRRRVEVALDCAVPGSRERLTGRVRLDGVAAHDVADAAPGEPHLWTPLTGPAQAEAALDFGGRPLARLRGRGYHDRNGGLRPLHELGMRRWMWGRFPLREHELIYYLLWPAGGGEPRVLALLVGADGGVQRRDDLRVELGAERRTLGGLLHPATIRLVDTRGRPWAGIEHVRKVESGPFYLRFQSEARLPDGERALGWGELCEPDRVDRALHRPLVRMRVHRPGAPNSRWLPLFSGPRPGRLRRLWAGWLPGGAR